MAAVNWDGTEKVIEQSCHTVTLTNDVIQKILCRLRTAISLVQKKPRILTISEFSTFYFKIPVEAPTFTGNKLYQDDSND